MNLPTRNSRIAGALLGAALAAAPALAEKHAYFGNVHVHTN